MWNSLRLYLETIVKVFVSMDFIGKILMDFKFICGYLITLCSIILLLIISKTDCASKSLLWVWGVTIMISGPAQ